MNDLEIKEPEKLLVYKKGYSVEFVRETIGNKSLNGLRIFDHLDPLDDLGFLKDYTFLANLDISSILDHDYLFLKHLTNLKSLFIGGSVTTKNEIDLSGQVNLIALGIHWRKHVKGLERCKHLQRLLLIEFGETDLTKIRLLTELKNLSIKTSSVKSLDGIEGCKCLESILLGNCRQLKSVVRLNHLHKLRKLALDVATQISDYQSLSDLPALVELEIRDCKKIDSISFIKQFPSLKKMILTGNTEIMDGDLTPVAALEEVFYSNKKHYNLKYPPPNFRTY